MLRDGDVMRHLSFVASMHRIGDNIEIIPRDLAVTRYHCFVESNVTAEYTGCAFSHLVSTTCLRSSSGRQRGGSGRHGRVTGGGSEQQNVRSLPLLLQEY